MSRIPSEGPIVQESPERGPQSLQDLDLDQFLQLMIVEMQNQDPLDPLDNSEILQQISQLREISSTDQLSNTLQSVLTGQNLSTASSLIGKEVNALSDTAEEVRGVIDRVSVEIGEGDNAKRLLRVHIGDQSIQVDNIREIIRNPTTSE